MDILFTEDIWSMETMPSPPNKLRVVKLENEILTQNTIFPPSPPDEEDDYVLLPLTSGNPWKNLEAPTLFTVTKPEDFHDFDNNCGQFTVYELANFECTNEQVVLYVKCNPKCTVLNSGHCSADSENNTMERVIVSCPPLKKVSNEEMIFAPDYSADFDDKRRLIHNHTYSNKEKCGIKTGIGNNEKSIEKNDVMIKEVEITSSSLVNKALDCKSKDESKLFKIPLVPKRRKSVLQPRNIMDSSNSNKSYLKPLFKIPNKKQKRKIDNVGIFQSERSVINIFKNDSNSDLEPPMKVIDAKPIAAKSVEREVQLPPRENNVNCYPETDNNSFPVLNEDSNDVLLNVKLDNCINEIPIEDVISVTVSSLESEENNQKKENLGYPFLETCLTDQINVKRIIDSVSSELSEKGLKEQNNTYLTQGRYRCRNICCNRHFRKSSCRIRHEKKCLKSSFVQWRDDEMFNETKILQTL